jgi:hypothetical protein
VDNWKDDDDDDDDDYDDYDDDGPFRSYKRASETRLDAYNERGKLTKASAARRAIFLANFRRPRSRDLPLPNKFSPLITAFGNWAFLFHGTLELTIISSRTSKRAFALIDGPGLAEDFSKAFFKSDLPRLRPPPRSSSRSKQSGVIFEKFS